MVAPATPPTKTTTSSSLDTYLSLISQYIGLHNYENAIFLAHQCVARHPSSLQARHWLGLAQFHAGNVRLAQHALRDVHLPVARYLLAECNRRLEEYAAAEQALWPTVPEAVLDTEEWILKTSVRKRNCMQYMSFV